MARRNLSRDSSDHAVGELDYLLRTREELKVEKVSIDEALHAKPLVQHHSDRDVTRVLFISQETELLNPTQQTLDGFISVSDMFDEVHILILRKGIAPRQPVLRPAKNVWIYTVAARYWWQLPFAARRVLQDQLHFASGFRADLLVARDPVESALTALWAHATFGRPAQLHVLQKPLSTFTATGSKNSFIKKRIAKYTIPKFRSIRAATQTILEQVQSCTKETDLALLPQHNPYEPATSALQTIDLKKKYPQYMFNLLCVTNYENEAALAQMLDGAFDALRSKRISLIMVGDGASKSFFKKRAKLLRVDEQIIYVASRDQAASYMKAADILLVPDTSTASEETVLRAAYLQIATIAVTTDSRQDMFVHNESIYLCPAATKLHFAAGIRKLVDDTTRRAHIAEQAGMTVRAAFQQDPEVYKRAYRASVESALFN